MSCKLKYIEDIKGIEPSVVETYSAHHTNAFKSLMANQAENGGELFTPTLYNNKKVLFFNSKISNLEKQRERAINEINDFYRTIGFTTDIIKKYKVDINGSIREIIGVNVAEELKEQLGIEEEIKDLLLDKFDVTTYTATMADKDFSNIEAATDIFGELNKNEEEVGKLFTEIQNSLEVYMSSVINTESNQQIAHLEKNIENLYKTLYYNKETFSKINQADQIIRNSYYVLDKLLKENQGTKGLQAQILNLSSSDNIEDFRKAAQLIKEMSDVFSFIEPFKDILNKAKVSGKISYLNNINTFRFEQELVKLANKDVDKENKIREVLKDLEISDKIILLKNINEIVDDFTFKKLEEIIDTSSNNKKDINTAFENMSNDITSLQNILRTAHFKVISNLLYSEQLKVRGVKREGYTEEALYDTLTDQQKINWKTKAQFEKELEISSDGDLSWTNEWFAAASKLNDKTLALYAGVLQKEIVKKDLKISSIQLNAQEKLKETGYNFQDEERKLLDRKIQGVIPIISQGAKMVEVEVINPETHFLMDLRYYSIEEIEPLLNQGLKPVIQFSLNYENKKEGFNFDKTTYFEVNLDMAYKVKNNNTFLNVEFNALKSILDSNKKELKEYQGRIFHDFFKLRQVDKSVQELVQDLKEKTGLTDFTMTKGGMFNIYNIEDMYDELTNNMFFKGRAVQDKIVKLKNISTIDNLYLDNGEYKVEYADSNKIKLLVLNKNGQYQTLTFNAETSPSGNSRVISGEALRDANVESVVLRGRFFKTYNNDYYKNLNSELILTEKEKDYYDFIIKEYTKANKNRGSAYQFSYTLPNITTQTNKSLKDRIEGYVESALDFKYEDDYTYIRKKRGEDGLLYMVDENGEVTDTPHYVKLQDVNGRDLNILTPSYSHPINFLHKETDSFISNTLYEISGERYNGLVNTEATLKVMTNLLLGNKSLGIQERQVIKKDVKGDAILKASNQVATKAAVASTQAFLSAMEYSMYGNTNDINIQGFSAQKVSRKIKSLNAYQVLAWNITAGLSNFTVGTYNNWLLAYGQKNGLSKNIMLQAEADYAKDIVNGNFVKDVAKKYVYEKSLTSQLALFFDAIKGSYEDGMGVRQEKDLTKKATSEGLFFQTILVEHKNQLTLMLAFLKSYKIKDSGKTIFDFIEHKPGNPFSFVGFEEYLTKEELDDVLFDIRIKLDKLNTKAHGQYNKLDSNKIQRHSVASLGWQFSKWIYSGYKARMGQEDWDSASNSFEEDGYFRTYFKSLFSDIIKQHKVLEAESAKETLKNYFGKGGLKQFKNIGEAYLKQIAHIADTATFRTVLSKNSQVRDWMYREADEKQILRINTAALELTVFTMSIAVGMMLRAIMDDDDEDGLIISQLYLQTERFKNDIGFFLPTGNPFILTDRLQQKLKDPMGSARLLDNNISFLSQMVGFEFDFSGEEFPIQPSILEKYDRSGFGYEKGDYKVINKAQKTILAPYFQMMKLLNPEQQLSYLNLLYKNSN